MGNRKEYQTKYWHENKEKRLEYFREYYHKNKARLSKKKKKHTPTKEKLKENRLATKLWQEENREYYLEYKRQYAKNNRGLHNAINSKRRAAQLKRTPKWADLKVIEAFYKNCPKGYHVDHIIPLQGKNVSGFHIIENLQYLPAVENLKKHNKF